MFSERLASPGFKTGDLHWSLLKNTLTSRVDVTFTDPGALNKQAACCCCQDRRSNQPRNISTSCFQCDSNPVTERQTHTQTRENHSFPGNSPVALLRYNECAFSHPHVTRSRVTMALSVCLSWMAGRTRASQGWDDEKEEKQQGFRSGFT